MLLEALYGSPIPALVALVGLSVSDSLLTVACARLYHHGGRDRVAFEGSFEITPYHQHDVDALRALSPRFWAALASAGLVLTLLHVTAAQPSVTSAG